MLHSALFDQADMDFSAPLSKPGQQYSDREQPKRFTNKQSATTLNELTQGPLDKIYQTATSLPGKNRIQKSTKMFVLHHDIPVDPRRYIHTYC